MRKLRLCIASLAVFALVFTSCSKEEGVGIEESEKATLSFGAIISDMVAEKAATKQAVGDLPACSDDTPAYVRVVVSQGDDEIVGSEGEPYRVDLATGQVFTVEDEALELDPGTYSLDHFSVYNADDELIWLAPRSDSELADWVDAPLPLSIDLGAGVKKYVDVPVLCFDDREVNEYGYLFFELDTIRAYEFCFFANYCTDDGRHYTANYSVDVWLGTNRTGTPLYTDLEPVTGINDDDDFFANPVCVTLPYNEDADEEYIYYEMTLLEWEDNYGEVAPRVVSGTLSRNDIEANFVDDEVMEYEHIRFNCVPGGEEPTGPVCLPNPTGDCERFTFTQDIDVTDFPAGEDMTYPVFTDDDEEIGTITFTLETTLGARDLLTANVVLNEGWTGTAAMITLPEYLNADDVCVRNINSSNFEVVYQAGAINFPVVVRFAANICP